MLSSSEVITSGEPKEHHDEIVRLLLLVGDEEKGQKTQALDSLLRMGCTTIYPSLEMALRNDDDADIRNGAMEVLVRFGKEVVPHLIKLLGDENTEVRNFSAVMLGNIGSREAVGPLVRALRDPDTNVRHGAVEALGKIGDPTVFSPLIELLEEDFWLQYAAVDALGEMRDKRAVPRLLEMLEKGILMKPVIDALGKIGDQRALLTLCAILGSCADTAVTGAAVQAIVAICQEVGAFGKAENPYGHFQEEQIYQFLNAKGVLELKQLLRQRDSHQSVSAAAVILLGWLKDTSAIPEFFSLLEHDYLIEAIEAAIQFMGKEAVPSVLEGLDAEVENVRIVAIRAIGHIGDTELMHRLAPLLADPRENVQRETLQALRGCTWEGMLPRLLDLVRVGTEDISLRAAEVVGGFCFRNYEWLVEQLVSSPDPAQRKRAAILLGHAKAAGIHILLNLCHDDDPAVRREAVRALGALRDPEGVKALLESLSDQEEGVTIEAVTSLAELGTKAPVPMLLRLLDSDSDAVVCAAVRALGKIGSDRAGSALLQFLARPNLPQCVELLIVETLGKISFPAASGLLADNYVTHPNCDVRRLAVQALANMQCQASFNAVEAACSDNHWSVRIAALHAAQKLGGQAALPCLFAALSDTDYLVRRNAIDLLGASGNLLAVPKLVEQLADHQTGKYAFLALLNYRHKGLVLIHQMLKAGHPNEVRIRLIDLLGNIADRRSVRPLMELLDDTSPTIRVAAIEALIFCFDATLLKKLLHLKMFDENERVKERADTALRVLTTEKLL